MARPGSESIPGWTPTYCRQHARRLVVCTLAFHCGNRPPERVARRCREGARGAVNANTPAINVGWDADLVTAVCACAQAHTRCRWTETENPGHKGDVTCALRRLVSPPSRTVQANNKENIKAVHLYWPFVRGSTPPKEPVMQRAFPYQDVMNCRDGNFVVTGGTGGCRDDNLRCHQWRQSWHHDGSAWVSVHPHWHGSRMTDRNSGGAMPEPTAPVYHPLTCHIRYGIQWPTCHMEISPMYY